MFVFQIFQMISDLLRILVQIEYIMHDFSMWIEYHFINLYLISISAKFLHQENKFVNKGVK